jgi:acyl-CoA hydrolase
MEYPASASRTVKTLLVLPSDTNSYGTIFGGQVLALIDEVAAIAAMRHCKQPVVTASIDSVDFLNPARLGDILTVEAFVTWTGNTSMEVYAEVVSENRTGEKNLTTTSFVTMVAIDKEGKPVAVPSVIPVTDKEKRLHQSAVQRRQLRVERRKRQEGLR